MELVEEIELQEPQQQPDPPTKKRALYDAVSKKYNLGTYEEYETKLKDPAKRKALYDFIGKEYELGTYQDFEAKVTDQTVKKKSSLDFSGSSLEAGNALSQSGGVDGEQIPTIEMYTAPNGEMVEANPIALSKKYNELSTKTKEIEGLGDRGTMKVVDDEDARKSAAKLKEDFKDIDLGGIYEETKDIPDDVLANVGKELMQDREQNNPLYQRKLANIKWRHGLEQQILADVDNGNITPENYNRIKDGIEMLPTFTGSGDYSNQRGAIQSLAKDIQLYGGANKQQILQDFAVEVSKVYGSAYKNNFDKYAADTPESKYLNNDEQLALQYLKDIAPEQAAQYDRIMIDPKLVKDDPDALKGYNRLKQTLEETGIGLQLNSVKEELNNLNNIADRDGALTDEQISKAVELEKKYGELTQKLNELDKKYPERIEDKVDDALQEIRGQKIAGLNYFGGTAYRSIKNTGQGIWEAVSTPFMSDASNTFRELSIMGEGIEQNNLYHKTDKNTAILTSEMVIEPELQKQIDAITNNKVMSESEKDMKVYRLLKDNTDKFGRVPVKGGKFNINPSSIMYGLSDLGTMLLPFVALETVTGGGATAGLARKFISTFTAAAATTFHAEYESALLSGVSQSDAYKEAMGMTAISSLAMAGAGTPAKIKAMVNPKTSAGQLILSMSDDAIQKVLDKGVPKGLKAIGQNFKERAKAIPKQLQGGLKTGTEFEVAMTAANEAKHQIYDTEIDREANFKNSLLMIGNFSGLGLMGQARFKTPTQMQKGAGLMFGAKPKEYIAVAEQMRKDGQLNEAEFNQRVELINQFGDAYKSVPKDLPENRKAEYLYQTVIKNEANKGKSDLPPKQAAEAEKTALVADHARGLILEPPTEKQLNDRIGVLERKLEPKKDAEGKAIELPEKEKLDYEAELEALTNESETRKSFEKVEMKRKDLVPPPTEQSGKDVVVDEGVGGLLPIPEDVGGNNSISGGIVEVGAKNVKNNENVFYHGTDTEGKIKVGDWKDSEGGAWFHSTKEGTIPYGNKVVEVNLSKANLKDLSGKTKQEAAIDYLIKTKQAKNENEARQIIRSEDTWRKAYKGLAKEIELEGFDGAKFKGELDKGNDVWVLPDSMDKIEQSIPTTKQQSGKDVVVDEGVGKDNPVLKDVESTAEWISENRDKLGEVDRFGNVKDFLTEKQNKDFFESNSDWDTYVAELYHNGKLRKEDVAKIEQSLSTKPEIKNEGSVGVGGDGKSEFTDVGYVVARKKADDILDDKKEATPVVGLRNAGSGSGVFVPFRMVKDEWIDSETTKREEGETYIYDEVNNKYYNTKDFSKSELDFLTDRDNFSEQPKSETKPIKNEEAKAIDTEITKLEKERDAEIDKVVKPDLKLELVKTEDLVNSKDPIGNRERHNEIKERYKKLRRLIECL